MIRGHGHGFHEVCYQRLSPLAGNGQPFPLTFNAHQQARYDLVLESLGDVRGKTVVDLGAGDGALSSLIARRGAHLMAVDDADDGLAFARQHFDALGLSAQFIRGSAESVPLPDGCADAVVSCDVIEHLDHYEAHVAEIARLLRPGGIAVITTPYRICETPAPFHIHEFYPGELREIVARHLSRVTVRETHHMFWNAFYSYRPRLLRGLHFGRFFTNILTLWFGVNPFLRDDTNRKKRDYFTQITVRAERPQEK